MFWTISLPNFLFKIFHYLGNVLASLFRGVSSGRSILFVLTFILLFRVVKFAYWIVNIFFLGIFVGSPLENGNAVPKPVVHQNGDSIIDPTTSDESNQGPLNGKTIIDEDTTTTSFTDNSPPSIDQNEETNDSVVSGSEGELIFNHNTTKNKLEMFYL